MNRIIRAGTGKYSQLLITLGALFLVGCGSLPFSPPLASPPPSASIVDRPINSIGCGKPALVPLGRSIVQTVSSGGLDREYLLHIPIGYQANVGMPLVLSFHGHNNTAREQEERSGLSPLADEQHFIVVYPQGEAESNGETGWATSARRAEEVNDVLFVSDLLNQLQTHLCIDPHRIYATGFSNGGGMTNLLACSMAGRLAAFAPVAGSYPTDPYPGGCQPVRPVPILEIHGTGDRTVPYNGTANGSLPAIPIWLEQWATRDGCATQPLDFYAQGNITGFEWIGCKTGATVVHYRIAEGGHVWPGNIFVENGPTGHNQINASAVIWSFFVKHTLPNVSESEKGS